MLYDADGPDDVAVAAVLLHPHPHFGGDRHHPLVSGLYRSLPARGVGVVRFDFSSADPETARDQVVWAVDVAAQRWPRAEVVLIGYSFGAGIAASVDDERVAARMLVAPPVQMLAGQNPPKGPTELIAAARDQFAPQDDVEDAVAAWSSVKITTVDDDHFLWNVMDDVVGRAGDWASIVAAEGGTA